MWELVSVQGKVSLSAGESDVSVRFAAWAEQETGDSAESSLQGLVCGLTCVPFLPGRQV